MFVGVNGLPRISSVSSFFNFVLCIRILTPLTKFVCCCQVSLVLVFMVGVIVYKLLVYRPLAANPDLRARAPQIANITGAFVNLTIIMILSRVRTI